jgi:hypothetical protein
LTSQRLTVQEAAEILDTSVDAVRMRVRRGSLVSEKDPDGRVYVWVDSDASETKPRLDGEFNTLISAKDETIATLREQLEAEREANRENRRIIAALTSRIPEIEPPRETPSEAPEAPASPGPTVTSPDAGGEPHAATQLPWWRRWLS